MLGTVRQGTHYEALVGGYRVLLLMPKLPGQALSLDMFCKLVLAKRQAIREAFEQAWIAVVQCGIVPTDSGLRNVLWDEEDHKCYIVDFEEFEDHRSNECTSPILSDDELALWIPSEEKVAAYLAAE